MARKRETKTLSTGQTHVIHGVTVRVGRIRKRKGGKGQVTLTLVRDQPKPGK